MKSYTVNPAETPVALILTEHEIHLIKSLNKGDLTPEQQKDCYDLIVGKICRFGRLSFKEENARMTDLNEGMRLVAIMLMHIAKTPYDQL